MSAPENRNLPVPTPDSDSFWAAAAGGVLSMQRCGACGEFTWFPRGFCVVCSSEELNWVTLSGRGTVYSFSIVSRAPNASFPPRYVLALVDLDEGPRMLTHVVDIEPNDVRIGLDVRVSFERYNETISLPVFAPTRSGS